MPLLVLARHAHTVPAAEAGTDDFDRPLSDAGQAQARRMGEHLASYSPGIDTVIASSAVRTVATAEAVAAGVGIAPAAVVSDPSLYAGRVEDWAEAMAAIPPDATGAVIVGHQPTVGDVVAHVTDGGASGQVPRFPPSSIAVFRLETWDELGAPGVAGAARPELIRHFKE